MEKVYMEAPRRNTNTWRSEDVSPYDFRDEGMSQESLNRSIAENRNTVDTRRPSQEIRKQDYANRYANEEDEYDMDAIMEEMNQMEDIEYDCHPELDMYDNGNIDWRWNEDVSQNPRNMTIDRKTIVEEENPKRKTTTWMRVRREY